MKAKIKLILQSEYWFYLIPLAASFLYFFKIESSSFRFDELVTVHAISHPNVSFMIKEFFSENLHPPLYFYLLKSYFLSLEALHFIFKCFCLSFFQILKIFLFGLDSDYLYKNIINLYSLNLFSSLHQYNELSFRVFSAIYMTVMNVSIFKFLKERTSIWIATSVAVLLGLNYKIIYYAQDARPYALFCLLFVLSSVQFFSYLTSSEDKPALKKLAGLNVLLGLTHVYGAFVVMAQILIYVFYKKKNIRWKISALVGSLFFGLALVKAFDFVETEKIKFLSSFNLNSLLNIAMQANVNIYTALLGYLGVLILAIRFIKKKKSKIDDLAVGIFVVLHLNIFLIGLTSYLRPIFGERYIVYLIPLQFGLLATTIFLLSEKLESLVKKTASQSAIFAALMLIPVYAQYENLFETQKYYEIQKKYPVREAYKAISEDFDFKENPKYILEEVASKYFKYYEDRYGVKVIGTVSPLKSITEKNLMASLVVKEKSVRVFYYLKVFHSKAATQENVQILGYKGVQIFSRPFVVAYKFTKED